MLNVENHGFELCEKLTKELNSNILERLQNVGLRPESDPMNCIVGLDAEITRLETTIELIRLLIQRICQCHDLEIDNGILKYSDCKDPSKQVRIRSIDEFYKNP